MEHLTEAELQTWLDRELEPDERARVSRHLEACATCRRAASELRAAAETFSAAMLRHEEDLAARAARPLGIRPPPERDHGVSRLSPAVPRWVGRAAAVVLLLGAAAAAAMVPGSPIRDLLFGPPAEVVSPSTTFPEPGPIPSALVDGASITVRPQDGRLTVRIAGFAPGTRIVVALTDGSEAVADLPDGAQNARFVVAPGTLDIIGSGVAAEDLGGEVRVRLPRSLRAGAVELDGTAVARVRAGRMITLRQVSRAGDEAVFEVGG